MGLSEKSHPVNNDGRKAEERDWSVLRQHLAALTANLVAVAGGFCLGWSSPALPLLQRDNTDVKLPLFITEEEGSWVSGLVTWGAALGSLPAGMLSNWLGRKKAIVSLVVPYVTGWLFILFADTTLAYVYVGRFLGGLGCGAITVFVSQYSEEIADNAIRGALGVYLDFSLCFGTFIANMCGTFMTYTWFTGTFAVLTVVFCSLFLMMPESPVYLIIHDRIEEAEKSLAWLRKGKKDYDMQNEIRIIQEDIKMNSDEDMRSFWEKLNSGLKEFSFKSPIVKSILLMLGMMFFQSAGAMNVVVTYAVSIFNSAGSSLSSNACADIITGVQSLTDLTVSRFVDRVGRRPMLMISAFITTVTLAVLCAYFHFHDHGYNVEDFTWIPVVTLVIFICGFTAGFNPIPWVLLSEMVPKKDQKWANSLISSFTWTMAAVSVTSYPSMKSELGSDVTFGIFSVIGFASGVFVWFLIPETKGKSREEIQRALCGDKDLPKTVIDDC